MMRKFLFLYFLFVLFGAAAVYPKPPIQPVHPVGFIYAEGDRLMLEGEPFVMKGFNYLPRDYGWTSMSDWDWEEVDQELALAASLNANTIRTGINYQYATGNINYKSDIYASYPVLPKYLEAIDKLLELADKHGLKVVLWLNDGLYCELLTPANFAPVKRHLEQIIPRYANDSRLAAWDLFTDLDPSVMMLPPVGAYNAYPWLNKEGMIKFLRLEGETVRALDPNHLQGVGFSWPSSSLLVQDFTDFLFFQFLGGDQPTFVTSDKIGEFEDYGQWQSISKDPQAAIQRIENKLVSIQSQLNRPMPIVLSEYGTFTSRPDSSEAIQKDVYETVLNVVFTRLKLAGALNWALTDFIWPPKAYTYVPMDAPMSTAAEQSFGVFRLDYSAKPAAEVARLYYRDAPELKLFATPFELRFNFSDFYIPSETDPASKDKRRLSVAFDYLHFLSDSGEVLGELDLGTPQARPYLAGGFFQDESSWPRGPATYVWAGGADLTAVIEMQIPKETRTVAFHAFNPRFGMQVEVLLNHEKVTTLTLGSGWKEYRFDLPVVSALKPGDVLALEGRFDLPINGGMVSIQQWDDEQEWVEVAKVEPQGGRFSAKVFLPDSKNVNYRAVWGGDVIYKQAESEPVLVEVFQPIPTATPTTVLPPTAAPQSSPMPVPSSSPPCIGTLSLTLFSLLIMVRQVIQNG